MDMESVATANREEVSRLVPLIIFLLLIIVTGIPGNLFVCAVYRKTFTRSSSSFFIFALAVVDLTGCVVVSLEVINVAQQYTFTNVYLCKATIFLELWPVLTSGCLLIVISIDRYRKVCHPFKWQLSFRSGKVLLAVCAVTALLCSWPVLILYGITDVNTHVSNVTGSECSILLDYKESIFSRIFNGMLLLLFVVSLTLLTVLYSLICVRVMKHEHSTRSLSASTMKRGDAIEIEYDRYKSTTPKGALSTKPSQTNFQRKTLEFKLSRRSVTRKTTTRLTYTMCIISAVFVVSFLPYTILRILEVFQKTFVESMSVTGRAFYKTFLRTYFLNCAINPFVYCACSSKFRKALKEYFRKFFDT